MAPPEIDGAEPEWCDEDTKIFLTYGDQFVPERGLQCELIARLIPPSAGRVVDLCCGEGLLSERVLAAHPDLCVLALDGDPTMLAQTRRRLARFGDRAEVGAFDLAASDWRGQLQGSAAVVSSLAIHHLDAAQKRSLFRDIYAALNPGGVLLIADLIAPALPGAAETAAWVWDEDVQRASLDRFGDLRAFEVFARGWNLYSDPAPDPIDQPSPLLSQLRWLEEAGFRDVDVAWMRAGHAIFGGRRPLSEDPL